MVKEMVKKVVAYITFGQHLLVFKHPDHPEAGIQVPAGTVAENESLRQAVMREAFEETGLKKLVFRRYLGTRNFDMHEYGKNEVQKRAFFHLQCAADPPVSWRHEERFPSGGSTDPIIFEFYWVKLPEEVPRLAAGQGALLEQVKITR